MAQWLLTSGSGIPFWWAPGKHGSFAALLLPAKNVRLAKARKLAFWRTGIQSEWLWWT